MIMNIGLGRVKKSLNQIVFKKISIFYNGVSLVGLLNCMVKISHIAKIN